jgi:two-component system OmpR family response regulator
MRLLLIEDEPEMRQTLSQALREEGFAVDEASGGNEGLEKATDTEYDVVVLDVMLPGLDGWEVLRRIRECRRTPVLMLTARDSTVDRVRGLNSGADDYLVKPFDLSELLARIRALIRRSVNQTQPQIDIGDVRIDMAARRVTKAGVNVTLTAKQYALLEYLALHRGELITRTQLYEHLFEEDEISLSNLLDVYVSNLRKKFGHDFITTRRGQGYCIENP